MTVMEVGFFKHLDVSIGQRKMGCCHSCFSSLLLALFFIELVTVISLVGRN